MISVYDFMSNAIYIRHAKISFNAKQIWSPNYFFN